MTLQQRIGSVGAVALVLAQIDGLTLQSVDLNYNNSFASVTVNGDTYAIAYQEDQPRPWRIGLLPEGGGVEWDDSGAVLLRRLLVQSSSSVQPFDAILQG